jgi:hypothetical protein
MTKAEIEKAAIAKAEADAKVKADAEAKEANANSEKEPIKGDDEEEVEKEEKVDYKAELAKEKEARAKADKATADLAFKLREKKRNKKDDVVEDEDLDEEDKPLTKKDLNSILSADREASRKEFLSSQIKDKATKLASSEDEADLIVEIHKNRTFPSNLSLDEQLEEACAIANRKSILAKNAELKRALNSKETRENSAAGTVRDESLAKETKLSPQDAQAIKDAGFVWDGVKRLYKKSLAGGKKHLFYDPKLKKRWVV